MCKRIRKHFTSKNLISFGVAAVLLALPETGWLTQTLARIATIGGILAIIMGIVFTITNEKQLIENAIWNYLQQLTDLIYKLESATEIERINIWNDITKIRNKFHDKKANDLIQTMIVTCPQ